MSNTQGATSETPEATATQGPGGGASGKTYTEAELQAEADRRATAAAETARKNAESAYEKRLNDEKAALEAARLAEQGEFKTLHEKSAAELAALKQQLQIKEQREAISAGLRDKGLTEFEAVLLADRTKPDDYIAAAESLSALFKAAVDSEVAKRLDTGHQATSSTATAEHSKGIQYPSMQKSA